MYFNNFGSFTNMIGNDKIFYYKFKKDGSGEGTENLTVDGSTTPVKFTLEDMVNEKFVLTKIDFILASDESIDIKDFGSVNGLSNGVLFNVNGQRVFKTNGDLMLWGNGVDLHSGRVGGETTTIINGHWSPLETFQNGISCTKESLYIEIRDDLKDLDFFQMTASGFVISD